MGRPQTKLPVAGLLVTALFAASAFAESDVLLEAVRFSLTGSDDGKVQPIDHANCVFRIESDVIRQMNNSGFAVFHLNNVQVDRLFIQKWISKSRFGERKYVTVELHGNAPVYETTQRPSTTEQPDDPEDVKKMFRAHPEILKPKHVSTNEKTIELSTSDSDRVKRAWQYIFSHGCVGQKSPF
jgi:hypothetical protein